MRTAVLYNFLIEATVMADIAILLMMVIRLAWRRQVGNHALGFGWLLIAARLLLPVSLGNPWIHGIRSPFAADPAIRPIAGQVLVRTRDMISDVGSFLWRSGSTAGADVADHMLREINRGHAGRWLMYLYLTGAGLVLGWLVVCNIRFRMQLRAGQIEPLTGQWKDQYEALCRERGVRPVPVILTDPLPSACLVGVLRPYIALPLVTPPSDVMPVLTHEVCHLKHHDHLWGLLRLACCVVHWFNPLVWLAAGMSRTDTELRCDDDVVKPMDDGQKRAYAHALVLAAARRDAPGIAVLATGMTMTGKRLKARVWTILEGKRPVRWLTVTFCVLAALCLIGALATSELPERTEYENAEISYGSHSTKLHLYARSDEGVWG